MEELFLCLFVSLLRKCVQHYAFVRRQDKVEKNIVLFTPKSKTSYWESGKSY